MRTMWLVVDDPDGFDYPQPWEVQDPEPWEVTDDDPLTTLDEALMTLDDALDAGWEPRGSIADPMRPARYTGRHRA